MIGTFLKAVKGTSLYGQTNNSQIFMKNHLNHHDFRKQHVLDIFSTRYLPSRTVTLTPTHPPGYVLHPIDRSCYHPQHKLHWNPAALPRHDLLQLRPLRGVNPGGEDCFFLLGNGAKWGPRAEPSSYTPTSGVMTHDPTFN